MWHWGCRHGDGAAQEWLPGGERARATFYGADGDWGGCTVLFCLFFLFFFYKLNSKRGKIKAGCMVLLSFDVPRRCWKCRFSWEFLREHQQGSVLSHAASHPSCPSQKPGCCQGAVTHPAWHRHCCPAAECCQCLPGLTAGP